MEKQTHTTHTLYTLHTTHTHTTHTHARTHAHTHTQRAKGRKQSEINQTSTQSQPDNGGLQDCVGGPVCRHYGFQLNEKRANSVLDAAFLIMDAKNIIFVDL